VNARSAAGVSGRRRVRLAGLLATTLVVWLSVLAGVGEAASSKVAWSKCFSQVGPYQCGTVQVPLDYDAPNGATISIALVRLPAGDPAQRVGSLFLNPGGPGGSGVEFTVFAGPALYTDEVRAKFDLVGFDPRGVGRSTALRCFGTPRQWGPYFTPFAFPTTPDEEQLWIAGDRYVDDACARRGGPIAAHMSTANVARDLDILRQAVGDRKLTYAGYSYGSYLGVTYANLFGDKVRALVVDGVLDPIAWSTGRAGEADLPFSTRLHSDAGAQATLDEFFRLCDAAGAGCAFSGDAAGRFAALAERLRNDPVEVPFPDGSVFVLDYSVLVATTLGALYDSAAWTDFAASSPTSSRTPRQRAWPRGCSRSWRARRSSPSAASRATRTSSRPLPASRAPTATTPTPTRLGRPRRTTPPATSGSCGPGALASAPSGRTPIRIATPGRFTG